MTADTLLFLCGIILGSVLTWYLGETDKRTLRRRADEMKLERDHARRVLSCVRETDRLHAEDEALSMEVNNKPG